MRVTAGLLACIAAVMLLFGVATPHWKTYSWGGSKPENREARCFTPRKVIFDPHKPPQEGEERPFGRQIVSYDKVITMIQRVLKRRKVILVDTPRLSRVRTEKTAPEPKAPMAQDQPEPEDPRSKMFREDIQTWSKRALASMRLAQRAGLATFITGIIAGPLLLALGLTLLWRRLYRPWLGQRGRRLLFVLWAALFVSTLASVATFLVPRTFFFWKYCGDPINIDGPSKPSPCPQVRRDFGYSALFYLGGVGLIGISAVLAALSMRREPWVVPPDGGVDGPAPRGPPPA